METNTKKKLVVLTGAGISAESGIPTFRDMGGLWEKYDITEVASPQAWNQNPELVLEFYNRRRRKLKEVEPNAGHLALVELESAYEVTVITQNVDDLHERAGSSQVVHLHGELKKSRSTVSPELIYDQEEDILLGDTCELGSQLRPHIVWFGEMVPMMEVAAEITSGADLLIVIGSSMQVYPAAGLVAFAPGEAPVYYIDPKPSINGELNYRSQLEVIPQPATLGAPQLAKRLLEKA